MGTGWGNLKVLKLRQIKFPPKSKLCLSPQDGKLLISKEQHVTFHEIKKKHVDFKSPFVGLKVDAEAEAEMQRIQEGKRRLARAAQNVLGFVPSQIVKSQPTSYLYLFCICIFLLCLGMPRLFRSDLI